MVRTSCTCPSGPALLQGFDNVNNILSSNGAYAPGLLIQIVVMKVIATSICRGSGLQVRCCSMQVPLSSASVSYSCGLSSASVSWQHLHMLQLRPAGLCAAVLGCLPYQQSPQLTFLWVARICCLSSVLHSLPCSPLALRAIPKLSLCRAASTPLPSSLVRPWAPPLASWHTLWATRWA